MSYGLNKFVLLYKRPIPCTYTSYFLDRNKKMHANSQLLVSILVLGLLLSHVTEPAHVSGSSLDESSDELNIASKRTIRRPRPPSPVLNQSPHHYKPRPPHAPPPPQFVPPRPRPRPPPAY